MKDNVAVVIPALDKNQYYPEGDLVRFGDTTLLEWKISQVLGVVEKENIFISTPSDKIIELAKGYDIQYFRRSEGMEMSQWIHDSVMPIQKEVILWTHVTSPFISARDYQAVLKKFFDLPEDQDSIITVFKEQEYIFFENKTLNFDLPAMQSRNAIEPVYRMTNGCFISHKESYKKRRRYFGQFPYYYEVDKFTALEIKDVDHYEIATSLLSMYFKVKEI